MNMGISGYEYGISKNWPNILFYGNDKEYHWIAFWDKNYIIQYATFDNFSCYWKNHHNRKIPLNKVYIIKFFQLAMDRHFFDKELYDKKIIKQILEDFA